MLPSGLAAKAPTFATVGVASALALAANANRTGLVLVNTSANIIYLAFGANAAVVGSGIALMPNGGTLVMDAATLSVDKINAISAIAGSNLAIQEFS